MVASDEVHSLKWGTSKKTLIEKLISVSIIHNITDGRWCFKSCFFFCVEIITAAELGPLALMKCVMCMDKDSETWPRHCLFACQKSLKLPFLTGFKYGLCHLDPIFMPWKMDENLQIAL